MEAAMSITLAAVLVGIAFLAGIGCTTLGPGGIFTTIALYTLTTVSSSTVAGTAQLTFIGVGLLGSFAYLQSGELAIEGNARMAGLLSVSSILGALAGAELNAYVSREEFGLLLGGFAIVTGFLIIYRERSTRLPQFNVDLSTSSGMALISVIGLILGCLSGLLGVGGPVIAVPVLIVLGVSMLPALAVAQVQSIFIATFATVGYALNGAVSLPLALLVGIPQLVGAFLGWRIAHYVQPDRLKIALGVTLIVVGPYLALQ
ncbi:sulfite exporter TauE/SafE family protein [Halomarina halobia]|uniref:Probable membrane transporter protein n=1 Tax=Halomarina halobia TaxID=3033386 RepID=A0ABD6AGP7_9EURY|nr:sulfite exporter TauE/SafE family protein [Halomarina sp. PSR21]